MTSTENEKPSTLNLSSGGKLELKKTLELNTVKRPVLVSSSAGRKTVTVEVKRRRVPTGAPEGLRPVFTPAEGLRRPLGLKTETDTTVTQRDLTLTPEERANRLKILRNLQTSGSALTTEQEQELRVIRKSPVMDAVTRDVEAAEEECVADAAVIAPEESIAVITEEEIAEAEKAAAEAPVVIAPQPVLRTEEPLKRLQRRFDEPILRPRPVSSLAATPVVAEKAAAAAAKAPVRPVVNPALVINEDDDEATKTRKREAAKRLDAATKRTEPRRQRKLTLTTALDDSADERQRSLASVRRRREKERLRLLENEPRQKILREVVLPEAITVQELANRMAERTADVVKELMKMGVMATATQSIDADTAELIISEFGHTVRRVTEADVELGMKGEADAEENLLPRAPVVTIMGHVDHGKTTLLDALRTTDVAAGESGGITQHIGAYKVTLPNGAAVTFVDTPGHEAFSEMRARGANVTDIVVLVVAADDSVMPQTIEAIAHAKAAKVPIIVAINKIDKPAADPARVKTQLLNHDLVVEELGGDILCVEVSAKARLNLDKLIETILLQAEVLQLRANPNRSAEGVVVEAKLDVGRGSVATVLVQRGTLRVGDIFVAGSESGKVRALINDKGERVESATPATPVEVLGLNGTPQAGDDFVVVENEARAREICDFRIRMTRDKHVRASQSTVEQLFNRITDGSSKEYPVVIKTDVHGSLEAITASLKKIGTEEVAVRILHSGVGSITESDITLARASNALVIAFNVRANPQARELARRDKVEIRYYSIIYNVLDDAKAILSGMLPPTLKEVFLGYASIRQVFNITKSGKVAGCMVTEGIIKRGCKVRLLRDNIVIHEGTLKTLKRMKDEVKEVKENFECGMAFENYEGIQEGDVIECFEIQEVARSL